jgi:hypothetical protein
LACSAEEVAFVACCAVKVWVEGVAEEDLVQLKDFLGLLLSIKV